jgi:hypothetical protein
LHRLIDIWATGEAGASLGFAAVRLLDEYDPIEKEKNQLFAKKNITGTREQLKAMRPAEKSAMEYLDLSSRKNLSDQEKKRLGELASDRLVQYVLLDSLTGVLIPACKLWNTGHGVNMMREAVSLMGGYGITEDCPGFLPFKWIDAQLEATYEGPEVVQRRQLSFTITNDIFLLQFRQWIRAMREIAGEYPDTGACVVASAMELWLWTLEHLLTAKDAEGKALYQNQRHGVTFPLADVFSWLVASYYQILDVVELIKKGPEIPGLAEGLPGTIGFLSDLSHVQAARAAGEVGRVCAELVFGYNRHPQWEEELEGAIPGILASTDDVIGSDGSHSPKAGPCVRFAGVDQFTRLRLKLDGCLTGSRIAKDRAAISLTQVMIPEALDYPA